MFFDKREKQVRKLVLEHLEKVGECIEEFYNGVKAYLEEDEEFEEISYKAHKKEHEADEIRREIQIKINEGAFLPFFRSDFITLTEMIDKIANRAKAVLQDIVIEQPDFPEDNTEDLLEIINNVKQCLEIFKDVLLNVFTDKEKVLAGREKVSELEQAADSIEWKLKKKVFQTGLNLAHKMQLKRFIIDISEIADVIENAADKCALIVTKQIV